MQSYVGGYPIVFLAAMPPARSVWSSQFQQQASAVNPHRLTPISRAPTRHFIADILGLDDADRPARGPDGSPQHQHSDDWASASPSPPTLSVVHHRHHRHQEAVGRCNSTSRLHATDLCRAEDLRLLGAAASAAGGGGGGSRYSIGSAGSLGQDSGASVSSEDIDYLSDQRGQQTVSTISLFYFMLTRK